MPSCASKETLLLRLIGQIYCCKKIEEIKTMVLDGIRGIIPYESAAFFLVDPRSLQYKDPLFRDLDRSWFKKYTDYYESTDIYKKMVFAGGIPFTDRSSDYINYRDWEKNEHRADFLLPQGIYHLACLQVTDGGKLVGEISLHRKSGQQDFHQEEMESLLLLHEHINNAFSRIKLACQRDFLLDLIRNVHFRDNPGLIIMDSRFNIINCNKSASSLINTAGKEDGFLVQIRAEFRARLNDMNYQLNPGLGQTKYAHGRDGSIAYRTAVITDNGGEYLMLVLVENAPGWSGVARSLNRHNITKREREIAGLMLMGKTNGQICSQLFISENTLKTHVRQLYRKLNVRNRSELAFKLYQDSPE